MRCERLSLTGDAVELAAELRRLVPSAESVSATVAEIVAEVRARGDAAVLEYTRRLDTRGAEPKPLLVEADELDGAERALAPEVREGLERAVSNVSSVATAAVALEDRTVELDGHLVRLRLSPVARAAVYVPGGRAPYPSTVVMGVVPAKVAGVDEVLVCTPPGLDGEVSAVVAAACRIAGASALYRMGGAQAVAALAYGTESVEPVDVIVGPGNLFVQEAKRQVFGQVGVEGFAGPSDLLVVADATADPKLLAVDLLAQAEHGPGTLVVGVSDSARVLDRVGARLSEGPETGAVAALVAVPDPQSALGLAEAFAPEHLQLAGPDAEALASQVRRAGCLFVGELSATAFGDYIAGSNHVLPTAGAARFASGLSPQHFLRSFSEVRIADASELAREAAPVARAEGFELHARSMEMRIRDNQRP